LGQVGDWFGAMFYDNSLGSFAGAKIVSLESQPIASQIGRVDASGEYTPIMTANNVTFAWGYGFSYSNKNRIFYSSLQDDSFDTDTLGIWDLNQEQFSTLAVSDSCFLWQYSDTLDTLYCFSADGQLMTIDLKDGSLHIVSTPIARFSFLLGSALDDLKSTLYVSAVSTIEGDVIVVEIALPSGEAVETFILSALDDSDVLLLNGFVNNA